MSLKFFALFLAIIVLPTASFAAKDSYTVNLADSRQLGTYMTNETFFTLYRYLSDPQDRGISTCSGACSKAWPPFYTENLTINPELRSMDFDVITRDDGKEQLTYKGWPLYLYSGDTRPYETNGQGMNGLWFVVNPQNLTR